MATYTGTSGNNTINGSNGDDTISGLAGDDILNGGNGDDTISGGDDNDTIDGGNSNDTVSGGNGNDTILGGNGNDTLDGDAGNDSVSGGNGNDVVRGGSGNDILNGDNGDDQLTGGGNDDTIDGGNGFDTAYYSGVIGEYGFSSSGGYLHVVHLGGAGPDGHDKVRNVERLVFADRIVDLTGGTNNAPVAVDDNVAITEDAGTYSSGSASVKDNDFDFEGQPLSVTPGTFTGTYGTLHLNANGTYTYTLSAAAQALAQGQNVTDSFNYTLSDGSKTDVGQLVFHIAGVNDAPVAHADTAAGTENQVLSINVLANDTDVDNGAVLTVTSASAPVNKGSASVVGNQVQFNPGTDFDHLAAGATETVVLNYSISDEFGATSSSTVTVTVTGTNDAPVAHADSATTDENSIVTVNVLANDTDVDDGAVLTVTSASAPAGQGSASVVGNQVQFDPGSDFDHLAVGATEVVTVTYTIQDEHGATSSSTVAITVTGTNDDPVANPDTATTSENAAITVDVLANDTDVDDGTTLTVTSASAPAGQGTASVVANQVQFDPGTDFDHLAEGASTTVPVTVNYSISDGAGGTSSSTLYVTVTGTNDGPVANADTATTSENAIVTVNVLANDTDVDDGAVLTVTSASAPAGQGSASVVGNQVQFNPGSDFDHLAVGESQVVNVAYSIQDEHGAASSSTIAITVTGTNDAPVIDAGGTDASGSATELPDNAPGENVTVHSDSGTIAFSDADTSDTHSASFAPQGGGYVGTFTLDPVNQVGDTVQWHYNVSDADLDSLDAGETVVQTYSVTIDDGHGGTATQDVTITLTGAADAVGPDGTNWYIDNSAVGSTQDGSPDNPYLSIAAFNAAQGSPTGPGVGDNIFLLAGTGTYAEADGINLLDGQTLTGVASGPLRPTIVATAGDGIDLAQNNNVMGVDIGSTSGVGIADGGTSVGTLTISDVSKSGSGQIVDIDQGGTLNVTLNSVASTGSTGGAIDLDGVGGSFTVLGATTITGVHSGGGIDVTATSANITFGGGGLVSTGGATAVNYVSNSGTLALGNDFDIVTTTATGLNASAGGTLNVIGAGNSIAATGGVALSVIGTAIGAADATFESISANGGSYAIRLNGTGGAGGLHVTGTGNVDGSGGLITNIGLRGIELIGTSEVSLANMTLTNANTVNGTSTDLDVSNSNASIYLNNVAGASLNNVDVSNSVDSGIVGVNVSDFVMNNSSVIQSGNGLNESGIEFDNLSGNSSVSNTEIAFSRTNSLDIVNTDVNLNLVLNNVTFRDTQTQSPGGPTNSQGEGGFQFRSFSTAAGAPVTNIDIVDSDFLRLRTQGIQIVGNDDSVVSADITNNVSDSQTGIGTGIELDSSGSAQFDFNIIGNTLTSRNGSAILINTIGGSDIEGRINNNIVTDNGAGAGLRIIVTDPGSTGIIEARNNSITMGTGNSSASIDAQASVGNARLDLTLDNNTVDSNTTAVADINVTSGSGSANEFSEVYLDLTNNHVVAGGPTNVLRLRTNDFDAVSDPRIFLTGFVEGGAGVDDDAVATWNARGNTPTTTAATVNVNNVGFNPTPPSAGTALVPTNPMPLLAHGDAVEGAGGHVLGQSELAGAIATGIQLWAEAGASAGQLAAMQGASFAIASLAGLDLGLTSGNRVLIDDDAAGYGWGAGGMDLLSAVTHELGHVAGLGDRAAGSGVMDGLLAAGEQRVPGAVFETGAAPSAAAYLGADILPHHIDPHAPLPM